jgi:hypothetical protein
MEEEPDMTFISRTTNELDDSALDRVTGGMDLPKLSGPPFGASKGPAGGGGGGGPLNPGDGGTTTLGSGTSGGIQPIGVRF